ncbi:MAG: C25 family cysteine peptidase, partial [Thermoplasmatota archaeon]
MKEIIISIIIISFLLNTTLISIGEIEKHPALNPSAILEDTQKIDLVVKNKAVQLGDKDKVMLTFSFNPPILTGITKNGKTYTKVMIEGLPISDDVGVPLLPVKPVNVLLPQQTKVESITVTKGEAIILGDGYNVELGSRPVIIDAVHVENEICEGIRFNPMLPYPNADFENIGTYNFRGYSILTLVLYPVHYIGQNKEIYYYNEMTVTIKTTEISSVNPLFRSSPVDEMMIREMVDDYSRINTYVFSDPVVFRSSLVTSGDSYEYVIITSEELKNATGEYTFQDLIQYKNDNNISATIVTVEDITAIYEGVDNAEKIRNFITDAYLNWGTEYVLLGGDDDVIPTRFLYVEAWTGGYETFTPSDLYYGCLDGTYNYDGDTRWGEPHDGEGGGDVDLRAEVYIGRACVGNESEVSNFVMKTLAYEQTSIDDLYLRKALMAGENLGWAWGGDYKDEIINGSNNHGYSTVGIPDGEYNVSKLYDRDWGNMYWPKSEIISRLNAGFNIINHLGHAGYNYNMKMDISDVDALTNDKYCFIYSQGCKAGGFDNGDCIAEHFTVKTSHGAFAGIWNARYGWGTRGSTDGPSQRFDREFFDAIFNEGVRYPKKTSLGVANQDSKEDNLWRINQSCMRWCYYELNLFGDPQVSLKPVPKYEHDLAVDSLELSNPVNIGETFHITTRIFNQGLNNETNVLGNISIMEIIDTVNPKETKVFECNWIIDSLMSGDDAVIKLMYTLPRGFYRISSNVYPIPGEEVIFNNNMNVFIFIGENTPPDTPNKPSGPKIIIRGVSYKFSTSATDHEGDRVYYQWFWGFDQFTEPLYSSWLGPYESGETITTYNTWDEYDLGVYQVKVRAKDVYGARSSWSEPLSLPINMPVNQQSSQQFIHPHNFHQQIISEYRLQKCCPQIHSFSLFSACNSI